MSQDKNNSKYFKFNDRADYIFYLSELIIDLIQKKDRLAIYETEIEQLLRNNPESKFVESLLYESISDKTNRVLQYIFNILGDESKKAVSYKKFRKVLLRQKNTLKIPLEELPQEEVDILANLNQLRNWALHIPESFYLQKKEFFKMDSNFINEHKNTIYIPTYEYFEIEFLIKMREEIIEFLESVEIIFKRMKEDYSSLIGGEYSIEYEINQVKPYAFMEAVQKSWDVQTGK